MQPRYHVNLGDKRTTVSLDEVLTELLALKLGHTPNTPEAHSGIRQWLQDRLEDNNDPGRILVSQWLRREALLLVADKKLSKAYGDWVSLEY